ncbi:hypothetical protein ABID82_002271 [Methylobacterium sp. PvP062]|uniref:NusG-like N-terminal domain-containing protein n=1 Tax=Methylobacterium radiotolerans TaxID=31998 RepID=A0ABV2NMZ4_9HYPH|nr:MULTISPECIES: transcription termination/antitermination NusG family protein [unclassified Methylobacterium]MBP2495396.1 hypothetical protein [Methylobacterium sp. PvP105]MBP2504733.1 hypothetical protein [Methylobacterium sp. PvP109]MCX7335744.1 hypothetical protein [Hyphomicrobiales bacterium]
MSRRQAAFAQAAGEPNPLTWHVAVTNYGCELRVREQMAERGIDTIIPMVRFWRVKNRQRSVAERPLMARTVIFGIDHSTQSLMDREMGHEWVGEGEDRRLVPTGRTGRLIPIRGLERIARGTDDCWAVMPEAQAFKLRFSILRGDFDATLRQSNPAWELPPMIQWLLERGEIPRDGVLTHKEARRRGLNFSAAA